MALEQRLDTLKKRHAELEKQISREEAHPALDLQTVQYLKREKLVLKDMIFGLENGLRQAEAAA